MRYKEAKMPIDKSKITNDMLGEVSTFEVNMQKFSARLWRSDSGRSVIASKLSMPE